MFDIVIIMNNYNMRGANYWFLSGLYRHTQK